MTKHIFTTDDKIPDPEPAKEHVVTAGISGWGSAQLRINDKAVAWLNPKTGELTAHYGYTKSGKYEVIQLNMEKLP